MKTLSAKPAEVARDWYLVDATDKVLGRLASQLASWRAAAPAPPSPGDAPHPQITEKLRALGYVQ